jgi:hypothetical protein
MLRPPLPRLPKKSGAAAQRLRPADQPTTLPAQLSDEPATS